MERKNKGLCTVKELPTKLQHRRFQLWCLNIKLEDLLLVHYLLSVTSIWKCSSMILLATSISGRPPGMIWVHLLTSSPSLGNDWNLTRPSSGTTPRVHWATRSAMSGNLLFDWTRSYSALRLGGRPTAISNRTHPKFHMSVWNKQ